MKMPRSFIDRVLARTSAKEESPTASVAARDAYIDLLVKVVANTIYQDPAIEPGNSAIHRADLRETGRDWPQVAHTMIGLKRLDNLRMAVETVLQDEVPGDFIETGVWRGGACILMRGILKAYEDKSRKVFVADSFAGLPAPSPERYPADAGDIHHTIDFLAVSREAVERHFAAYDLLDEQVRFIEGFFEDTLPQYPFGPLSVLRLDGDMYSSTIVALEALYPRLSPGGFLIIDDFGAVPACKKAVEDYRAQNGITEPIQIIDWAGAYWRKS